MKPALDRHLQVAQPTAHPETLFPQVQVDHPQGVSAAAPRASHRALHLHLPRRHLEQNYQHRVMISAGYSAIVNLETTLFLISFHKGLQLTISLFPLASFESCYQKYDLILEYENKFF